MQVDRGSLNLSPCLLKSTEDERSGHAGGAVTVRILLQYKHTWSEWSMWGNGSRLHALGEVHFCLREQPEARTAPHSDWSTLRIDGLSGVFWFDLIRLLQGTALWFKWELACLTFCWELLDKRYIMCFSINTADRPPIRRLVVSPGCSRLRCCTQNLPDELCECCACAVDGWRMAGMLLINVSDVIFDGAVVFPLYAC